MPAQTAVRYWLPPLLWTAVIFTASTDFFSAAHTGFWLSDVIRALTGRSLPPLEFEQLHFLIRKAAHLTEYAILSALLYRAIRGEEPGGWRLAWAAGAIALSAIVGASDEWHQSFVPSRTPSAWDVLIDSGGAALAQIIIRLVLFFRP